MYNHQLVNYICPFCKFVKGEKTSYNKLSDIVYKDDLVTAFISPKWWSGISGNVIVISNEHYENIYDLPDSVLAHIYIVAKKIAIGMKETYGCEGTSTRQHNEPGAEQDVFHFHLHILPRHKGDNLYQNTDHSRIVDENERLPFSKKLKEYFNKIAS